MMPVKNKYSRQELYDLVWSMPMSAAGPKIGLSGTGLAKLCRRHDIPLPQQGYWQRKQFGKIDPQSPLKPAQQPHFEQVSIYLHEDFRRWLSTDEIQNFEDRIAKEATSTAIVVPNQDSSRVPVLVTTRQLIRGELSYAGQDKPHFNVRVLTKENGVRAMKILTAIHTAGESRGYRVKLNPLRKATCLEVCGHLIEVKIEERSRRVEHVLTPSEEKAKARGYPLFAPKYDYISKGKLYLIIEEYVEVPKKTFYDSDTRKLEAQVSEFMVALLRTAMVLGARDNERLEQERERQAAMRDREERERRRIEEEKRKAEEEKRRQDLLLEADMFQRVQALLHLIAAVQEIARSERPGDAAVLEWVKDATQVAEELNPVSSIVKRLLSSAS